MKNFNISVLALAIGLTFNAGAMAEGMSDQQYKSHEKNIEAEYKLAKAKCASFADNANDICIAEAKGKKDIASAELEASYKPSAKTHNNISVAKADAAYSVAIEKCDDKAGNDKNVCVKEAQAARVHQIADAKAQLRTSNANTEADQTSSDANAKAMGKKQDARSDALKEKREADYVVAKGKCDALAGDDKAMCMINAKARYDDNAAQ